MTRTAFILTVAVATVLLPSMAQRNSQQSNGNTTATTTSQAQEERSRGERVFKQNCSRCHNSPQGFPPQISGTIARHMRVRASLNAADERALLHFLNP